MMGGTKGPERSERELRPDVTPDLSDDRLYRALASTSRRRLLWILQEGDESTVDELATVLVGWDATDHGTMRTDEDRKRVIVGLAHVHLPLLADLGLLAYDRGSGTVRIEPIDPLVHDLIRRSVGSGASPRS
ncbi:ArsR family transcriptional regulator [Halorubrum sp. JWXQ-INN 858]|uniref:DUF7344 domain-containing protein n=1 Tax=Halorubrum sp. JWXQ-INN 858 TaxID=2690782 RepID=UPI001F1D2487|nr:ArsR family transcriptional regulator [Halorubrum sp. JWXQ-INN 858]